MLPIDRRTLFCQAAALAVLAAMLVFGVGSPRNARLTQAYLKEAAKSIDEIPYRIGNWIGRDVEAQAPAIELLQPNKLLQRRYLTSDGTSSFSLLLVHCSDARDMQGHYPPICYPAHGWIMVGSTPASFAMGQSSVPCTIYRLSTIHQGTEQRMTILNFFAVPSQTEPLAADMTAVDKAAKAAAASGLGAAQIQVILPKDATPEEMKQLLQEVGPAIEPAIRKVVHGL